ncbi:MAG TPA: ABC transporter ATP-binding protein [Armatimonadota bacterium]|nr:ABC transporter ATP-binding protein [Armatimonadota bacterium]
MASGEIVLQTDGLTKVYRSLFTPVGVKAVDDLNLSVRRGETYSIVGPNGSGKTTTLKILLGLIFPTAGSATIFDKSIADLSVRGQIGFLPEDAYLYDVFNGEELLDFYAGLFGYSKRRRKELVDELLSLVGMQANRKVPFRECSKGMRQRLALAQALVNDPELLILDEPTSGLDPAGRHQMTRLILELKRRGKTILLCSHFLAEVEEVCDRVGIMYRGRLVAEGTLSELAGEPTEIVVTTSGIDAMRAEQITSHSGVLGMDDGVVRIGHESAGELWSVLETIHRAGGKILEVRRPRPSLQDVFVRAIRQDAPEEAQ